MQIIRSSRGSGIVWGSVATHDAVGTVLDKKQYRLVSRGRGNARTFVLFKAGVINVTAPGDIDSIDLTSIAGDAVGGSLVAAALSSISLNFVSATVTASAIAAGLFPVISLSAITSSVSISGLASGNFAPIQLSAVEGTAASGEIATGLIAQINLNAISALVIASAIVSGDFAFISLTAPTGTATGAAGGSAEGSGSLAAITLGVSEGSAIGGALAGATLRQIQLTAPIGTAYADEIPIILLAQDTSMPTYNTYADIAFARDFANNVGLDLPDSDQELSRNLLASMPYIETRPYQGHRTVEDQSLEWPRKYVVFANYPLADTAIPENIKRAQVIASFLIGQGVELTPTITGQFITKEKVGPIETEYSDEYLATPNGQALFNQIEVYLKPYYRPVGDYKLAFPPGF